MFEAHGWPERKNYMMTSAPKRIVETYGSIRAFKEHFAQGKPLIIMISE